MATRSGGTGIVATLVIFVITTVALLVTSVLLFNAKGAAERQRDENANQLRAKEQQISSLESAAQAAAQALGVASIEESALRSSLKLGPSDQLAAVLTALRSDISDAQDRVRGLQSELEQAQSAAEADHVALEEAQEAFRTGVEGIRADVTRLTSLTDSFQAGLEELRSNFSQSREDLRADFDSRRQELEAQLDEALQARATLASRLETAEASMRTAKARAKDAATLVDARIVEVSPDASTVYIDLGRRDRLRPGMTFEVYADPTLIGGGEDGGQAAGKASVEVVRVGDTTSEARVTRLAPRTSIHRDEVLANAIYSPDQRYAFLLHGLFDTNGDGIPSRAETDFVRQRVVDWNGQVTEGDEIAGDVDFIIIGARPVRLPVPPLDATDEELAGYAQAEEIRERYDQLLRAAAEAQIPVLNWNRLQVLTGAIDR